jgi:hypothetical protein
VKKNHWFYKFKIGWKVVGIQMLGLKSKQNNCFKDLNLQNLLLQKINGMGMKMNCMVIQSLHKQLDWLQFNRMNKRI